MGVHKNELVDIEVHVHWTTDKARLVSTDGEKANAVWIPMSQSELNDDGKTLVMPEWVAISNGLV